MLDQYLQIQAREQEKTASRDRFVDRMMLLPTEELHHIQQTGEIKLAFCSDILSSDDRKTWLDNFKGTPLFAQAIALEEEDLKMQAADDQSDQVESQERATKRQARDALRLEKRLLELELVKSEQSAESAALPPPAPSPGMGAPPGMGEQGAGAPGDVPPAEIGKMASVLKAAAEKVKKDAHDSGDLVGRHLHHAGALYGASEGAKKYHGAAKTVGYGRKGRLAGAALGALTGGVIGHSAGRLAQGVVHGAAHAKDKEKEAGVGDFLRAAAPVVGDFVKKHPGAAIGGGLGALHGLMHQGGGVGSAVLEGAGGAALGHAGEHMYRSGSLQGIKDAVMPASNAVAKEAAALLPFSDEKNAGHAPEKVLKALRGASAKRVGEFGRSASFRKGLHDSGASHGALSGAKNFKHHVAKGVEADSHRFMAMNELGRKEGLRSGHLHGAVAAGAAGAAGLAAGKKHEKGEEKQAFIGAMLGALGGAAARGGMGAAASGALGAGAKGLMSGGMSGLASQGMNWLKSNPMKAVGGAMNAASNFASARQQGQGLGSSALSGLAGGASALG